MPAYIFDRTKHTDAANSSFMVRGMRCAWLALGIGISGLTSLPAQQTLTWLGPDGDWGIGNVPNSHWSGGADWANSDSAKIGSSQLNLVNRFLNVNELTVLGGDVRLVRPDDAWDYHIAFAKVVFNNPSSRLILDRVEDVTINGDSSNGTVVINQGYLSMGAGAKFTGGNYELNGSDLTIEASTSNVVSGGTMRFTGDFSSLYAKSDHAIMGGQQYFSGSKNRLRAWTANALTGGHQYFEGSESRLEAYATNSVTGGIQDFTGEGTWLDITAAGAVTGGTQNFSGHNTQLSITGQGGISGGTQNFSGDDSHMFIYDQGSVTGGDRYFSASSGNYLDVNVTNGLSGGVTHLQGNARITVNAENGTTKGTSVVMETTHGTANRFELVGVNTALGGLSGTGGLVENRGSHLARLTLDYDTVSHTFGGLIQDGFAPLAITKAGTGQLVLTGENTYTGGTILKGGETIVGSANSLGTNNIHFDGGTLTFTDKSFHQFFMVDAGGGGVKVNGTNSTVEGLQGTGSFTKTGVGNLTLIGAINFLDGDLHVNEGTVTNFAGKALRLGGLSGHLVNDGALIFSRTGEGTVSGLISGAGTVEYKAGVMTVTNANTYANTTWINGAYVRLGNDAALSHNKVTITSGGIGSDSNLAVRTVSNQLDLGGSFRLGRNVNLTGPISLIDNTTITSANGDAWAPGVNEISGNITGAHSITFAQDVNPTGRIVLSGNDNNYTGGTTFAGGVVELGSFLALGTTGTITFSGGTLRYSMFNGTDYSGRFNQANGQLIRLDTNGRNSSIGALVAGSNTSLTKLGEGTLSITSFNTYGGGTFLEGGTLGIHNAAALGSGRVTVRHGAIRAEGDFVSLGNALTLDGTLEAGRLTYFTGGVTLASDSTLSTNNPDGAANYDTVFSGVIDGAHSLSIAEGLGGVGTGSITLTGHNTYTGGTILKSGRLAISNDNNLGSGGALTFNGGTLKTSAGIALSRTIQVSLGGGTFDTNGFNSTTQSIQGTGALHKTGSGELTMSADSIFAGELHIDAGTFHVGSGHTLQFGDGGLTGMLFGDITSAGTVAFNRSNDATYGGSINGGSFRQAGTGRTILTGSNNFSSGITLANGILNVGSLNALGSVGTIDFQGGTLQLSAANHGDYSARFSSAANQHIKLDTNGQNTVLYNAMNSVGGSFTKLGGGAATIVATNTYTGGTFLNEGTLYIENSHGLGSGALTINGGSIRASLLPRTLSNAVNLNGNFILGRDLHFQGATTLQKDVIITSSNPEAGSTGSSFDGPIGGNHSITLVGLNNPEPVTFNGTNTYTGGTHLNGAVLQISSNENLGSTAGALTFNGGTLRTTGNVNTGSRSVIVGAGGGTVDTTTGHLNISSYLGNEAGLTKSGANTLAFENAVIVALGKVHATAGTVQIKNSAVAGGAVNLDAGTHLNIDATVAADVTIEGAGSVTVTNVNSSGQSAVLTGEAKHTGGTTITSGGSLRVGVDGHGALGGNIVNNGVLWISQVTGDTFSGSISGTGRVDFGPNTGHTLRITGGSSYSGLTNVGLGTVRVAHNNAFGDGTGTVSVHDTLIIESGYSIANKVIVHDGNYNREITGSIAHAVDATSSLNYGTEIATTAKILAGSVAAPTTLVTSFSGLSAAHNDARRLSDVYSFSGTGSSIFVLELSFTSTGSGSMLGWLNEGNWVNAVDGNAGNNATLAMRGFQGTFEQFQVLYGTNLALYIGAYGRTTISGQEHVWSVLNHNSDFAGVVPEPSTWALLGLGLVVLVLARRRSVGRLI